VGEKDVEAIVHSEIPEDDKLELHNSVKGYSSDGSNDETIDEGRVPKAWVSVDVGREITEAVVVVIKVG
jgi:hypothetical protein